MLKKPSAFLPLAFSLTVLVMVLGHMVFLGTARDADEGAAAQLWQLLMVAQLPLLVFFAIRWLPRSRQQALKVMALQASGIAAAVAPVYFLHL
jgi:hypothetical protein